MSSSLELTPTLWPGGPFTHHPYLSSKLSPTQEASHKLRVFSPSPTLSSSPNMLHSLQLWSPEPLNLH